MDRVRAAAREHHRNTQTVTELHDGLGRMTARLATDETSAWIWDAATKGLGKLARTTSASGVTKELFYDDLSRLNREVTTVGGDSFAIGKSYKPAGVRAPVDWTP
jgi:YD repeat-containing protein